MCESNFIETLRYFYSDVFQGFAALISFGIVVFTVYLQKLENQMSLIEQNYYSILKSMGGSAFKNFAKNHHSFFDYCKKALNNKAGLSGDYFNEVKPIFERYLSYHERKSTIIAATKYPLISSSMVLVFSITLLLFVDKLNTFAPPIFLLIIIFWALIEIIQTIKFSLEFKIVTPTKNIFINKILNTFYWKNR